MTPIRDRVRMTVQEYIAAAPLWCDALQDSEMRPKCFQILRDYVLTEGLLALLLACSTASAADFGANLVPPEQATHTAVKTGSWQDAATWDNGVPGKGAKVYIPENVSVTNHAQTADILWLHVAGTYQHCTHCDTKLSVHTIFVPMMGRFHIGRSSDPIEGTATIEFLPGPYLDSDWQKLSLGVICHGEFTAAGVEKTAWLEVAENIPKGATTLKLSDIPWNWQPGDEILIAGTDSVLGEDRTGHRYQSEFVTIESISGRTVTFSPPTKYRHFRWRDDLPFHCANLTRNVKIVSRDPDTLAHRGHLMFMSHKNDIRFAEIVGLGRTDASRDVTDPRKDASGNIVPGSTDNPRARYSDHLHRVGPMKPPAIRNGVVCRGVEGTKAKWGFLNHDSHVNYYNCIALEFFGSGFATEEGQERGKWVKCLSALNKGFGDSDKSVDRLERPFPNADWNKDGSGFWSHSGLMEVQDCVAFDNAGHGFGLFIMPFNAYPRWGEPTPRVHPWLRYPIEHDGTLLPEEYGGAKSVPAGAVPLRVFDRNTAYNNGVGIQVWGPTFPDQWPVKVRGRMRDVAIWGRGARLNLEYTRRITVEGLKVIGDLRFRSNPSSLTKWHSGLLIRFDNITVKGYDCDGMMTPWEDVGDAEDKKTHVVELVK